MSLLDPVINSIRTRLTRLERSHPKPREGRVTQSYPMQVRLDGDTVDTPVRQIATASVGSRVLCMKLGFRYYMIGQVGGQGAMLLDEINLPTNSRTAVLNIPPSLRGTFQKYVIEVQAGAATVSGTTRTLSVRINSDSSENYRSNAVIFGESSVVGGSDLAGTAFPRTMYLGSYSGFATVSLFPKDIGRTGFVSWAGHGWTNGGGSAAENRTYVSGGRWNGSTTDLTHFTLYTNNTSATYTDSPKAMLWGHR